MEAATPLRSSPAAGMVSLRRMFNDLASSRNPVLGGLDDGAVVAALADVAVVRLLFFSVWVLSFVAWNDERGKHFPVAFEAL